MIRLIFLTLLFFSFTSIPALASPCCSGSAVTPTMITGEAQTQLSLSFSNGSVIGDATKGALPVFRSSSYQESLQTLQTNFATLLSDRFQAGLSLPLMMRQIETRTDRSGGTHLGDMTLGVAYEFMPEWTYSEWKPRGFVFAQVKLPTGRSVYEVTVDEPLYWGRGFYTISVGAAFVKQWRIWDASVTPEVHYSLDRTFESFGSQTQVSPGWGGSLGFSGGVRPDASMFRIGLQIQPVYEMPKEIQSRVGYSKTAQQLVWNAGVSLGLMVNDSFSAQLAYNDQTLLGPAINTTLTRTVSLAMNYAWLR